MTIKDANDLLQSLKRMGAEPSDQVGRVKVALAMAEPLVLSMARVIGDPDQVGAMTGVERDEAIKRLAILARSMPDEDYAHYEKRIAKAVGQSPTSFRSIVRAKKDKSRKKDEENDSESIETTGGFFLDHLIELMYDPERMRTFLAVRYPDGHIEATDSVMIHNKKYVAMYPNTVITKQVVLLPSELLDEVPPERELLAIINAHLNKYFDFGSDEFFEHLCTYYVLFTYLYDGFQTLPYIRALGDYGTGKSRLLRTMGRICYRPVYTTAGSSASSLFRTLDTFRGTLVLDEGDFNDSDEASMIAKILNGGTEKGTPILRSEKESANSKWDVAAYDVYGPKIIGMRKDFGDQAIASRCLTKEMMPTAPHPRIPPILPPGFEHECQEIRNLLLAYRMRKAVPERVMDFSTLDRSLEPRLLQITLSLITVIDDEELRRRIGSFLSDYNETTRQERYETKTARVIEGLVRAWAWGPVSEHPSDVDRVYLKDISQATNDIMDQMNRRMGDKVEEEEERTKDGKRYGGRMTSKSVSNILRKYLQMKVRRATDGTDEYKGTMYVMREDERLRGLCERWGVALLKRSSLIRPAIVTVKGDPFKESREEWYQDSINGDEK